MAHDHSFGKALLVMAATACVTCAASAQSLGDVARNERARRDALKSHSNVLTNEDLKREQILNGKPMWPAPESMTVEESVAMPVEAEPPSVIPEITLRHLGVADVFIPQISAPDSVSLGEYARVIRAQRAHRAVAHAKKIFEAHRTQPAPPVKAPEEKPVEAKVVAQPKVTAPVASAKSTDSTKWYRVEVGTIPPPIPMAEPSASAYLAPQHQSVKAFQAEPKLAVRVSKQRHQAAPVIAKSAVKPAPVKAPVVKAAAAPKAPETNQVEGNVVRVQRGESLWTLARKHLGSGKLWTKLWKANPSLRNPNIIRAGMTLSLPLMPDMHVAESKSNGTVKAASVQTAATNPQTETSASKI